MVVDHGNGSCLEAELLRPQQWVEFHQLFPGKSFRFHSEDLEVTGSAVITAIQPAPEIAEGDGRVVISRFVTHGVNSLATVMLENGEQLTGTRQHPIWCENREEWTQLAELQPGDLARSRHGLLQVAQVTLLHDTQTVYNLEVHGEHVYELLDCGILVHNSEEDCAKIASELLAPNTMRGAPTNLGPVGSKAPRQVTPGIRELEGHYINDRGISQPWRAHYDEHGRMIGRTDYNAGNRAAGIPDIHHERWEYNAWFPLGRKIENHIPGEFLQ